MMYRPMEREIRRTAKEFQVWDGEGGGVDDKGGQNYILFGYQNLDRHEYIYSRSLRTEQILEFINDHADQEYIHVAFGFNYDVDQILKDVDSEHLRELLAVNVVVWRGWKITYIPGKMFKLKKAGKGQKQVTICDAFSFFGTSLIRAAKQYCPDHPQIGKVKEGKDQRGDFEYSDLFTTIIPYWQIENELLLGTMNALRYALKGAGISVTSWHGPGAVANALIKKHRIGTHVQTSRDEMPLQVTEACQFAYFGGRFENWKIGRIPGPIYSYDLRSAYPAAMAKLPGLKNGQWRQTREVQEWGVYRYTIDSPGVTSMGMGALPNRLTGGGVSFSLTGSGWSFGHEIVAAQMCGYDVTIHDGWVYDVAKPEYPFIYNHEMYVKRAQYKKAGNPAQLGLKLGMSSGYGKLAQTIGYDEETMTPPKYHHPWYSGHITSWCRARIMLAMHQAPDSIIACETDGIYSLAPLDLAVGPHLGQWEENVYDEMYYVQNGFYFARKGECPDNCPHDPHEDESECAWTTAKVRGMSAHKNSNLAIVFASSETLEPIETEVTRYGSLTGYIDRPGWHSWQTTPRVAEWGGGGKRYHEPAACPRCQSSTGESYHRTVITAPFAGASQPRGLPWTENPELSLEWV